MRGWLGARALAAAGLVVVAAVLVVYVGANATLESDLTHFMPEGSSSELASVSRELADSELSRTMVLTLEAPETSDAVAVAKRLAARLREDTDIEWVRSGLDATELESFYEIYFPRRRAFVSNDPERAIPAELADEALRARARALRAELASPMSTLYERLATRDPLGWFRRVLERLEGNEPRMRSVEGQFVSEDGAVAILLLRTRPAAFDYGRQVSLLERIRAAAEAIAAEQGVPVRLEQSGTNRFVVATQDSMQRDFYQVAALAFVGIALIYGVLVGTVRLFPLVMLPTLAGVLVATAAGLHFFGALDGLTLAFAISLTGVSVDYAVHLLVHARVPGANASAEASRLRGTLTLGAVTTMASVAGLAFTAFPAFREIAFVSIVGLAVSLVVTLVGLPVLLRGVSPLPARSLRVVDVLGHRLERLASHRVALALIPLAILVVAPFALARVHWQDDLSKLTVLDPELLAEDARVRGRIHHYDLSRFVIAVGDDADTAIAANDRAHARLAQRVLAGDLGGVRSLHALLWSEDLQRRNERALAAEQGLYARLDAAFAAEGFRPGAFASFRELLEAPTPPPLTLADLRESSIALLIDPLVVSLGDRVAVISYLRDVRSPDAIRTALAGLEGVHLFDQKAFVNDVFAGFRATTVRQIAIGSALVAGLLWLRYRRVRPTVAALLPSLLVVPSVLGALAFAGVELNLLHVMSLVMVLGMGVDYGIFVVDTTYDGRPLGVTLLGLLVSCLTTVFVFGSLAISEHPVLRAVGTTAGLGVALAFLYCPLALLVVRQSRA